MNTVSLIPILSTNIPAIGEQHSVDPKVRDPIRAKIEIRYAKNNRKKTVDNSLKLIMIHWISFYS